MVFSDRSYRPWMRMQLPKKRMVIFLQYVPVRDIPRARTCTSVGLDGVGRASINLGQVEEGMVNATGEIILDSKTNFRTKLHLVPQEWEDNRSR